MNNQSNGLDVLRAKIIAMVEELGFILQPACRFMIALMAFMILNSRMGFAEKYSNMFIVMALSLICAVMPSSGMVTVLVLYVILQCFSVNLLTGVFISVILAILFIFFLRFAPRQGILMVLTPLAAHFGVLAVVPMLGGLLCAPAAVIPMVCGLVIYEELAVVASSAQLLKDSQLTDFAQVFQVLIDGILQNSRMVLLVITLASVFLIVYSLRRMSVNFSWHLAIAAGAFSLPALVAIGGKFLDTTLGAAAVIPGVLLGVVLGELLRFFCFRLDYENVQNLQFEDDDYYYYVKAVPKVGQPMNEGYDEDDDEEEEQLRRPQRRRRRTQPETSYAPVVGDVTTVDLEEELVKAMDRI